MAEEKKDSKNKQTKAGMLEEADDHAKEREDKTSAESKTDRTPKIGKEKAENRNDERPLH